jgi:hypothetical protein
MKDMPRRQQKAAAANMRRSTERSGHQMIEDSILFGPERFVEQSEERLQRIDEIFYQEFHRGPGREGGIRERYNRRVERDTLLRLSGEKFPQDHYEYLNGLKLLLDKRDIRRKSRGRGYVITPQGKKRLKHINASTQRFLEIQRQ